MTPNQPAVDSQQQTQRIVWIDWLRVIAVLLIFAFHSARVFDSFEKFYAKGPQTSFVLSWFVVGFFDTWQMPLLFVLAGMSSYFALKKRTGGQYMKERAARLLVPFVFGCFVIVPPQSWFGAMTYVGYTGSLAQFLRDYFSLKWGYVSDYIGGPNFGHLWFILFLFVVSAVALPVLLWIRGGKGEAFAKRMGSALAKPWWWLVLATVLLLSTALPALAGHNPFTFLVWFLFGVLLAVSEEPRHIAHRRRWELLSVGGALAGIFGATYWVRGRYPDPSLPGALNEFAFQLAGVLLCLALIGIAIAYLDRPSRHLPYLSEASYPTYVLHQTVIVAIGFYLVRVLPQPIPSWLAILTLSLVSTYAIYEFGIRRWPWRVLFGMKPEPSREST